MLRAVPGELMASDGRSADAGQTFYRYRDPGGRITIVDSLDKLPPAARDRAERVELQEGPSELDRLRQLAQDGPDMGSAISWPSFGLGLGVAAVCVVVALLARRAGAQAVAKLLGIAALVAVLGALYLGMLRRSTGQGTELLSTPGQILEDTKRTIDEANQQRRRQQEMLDQIEQESN